MRILRYVLTWVRRLPARFTILLAVLLVAYLWAVSLWVTPEVVEGIVDSLLARSGVLRPLTDNDLVELGAVGIVVLLLLGVGLLLCYNGAALLYRWVRKRPSVDVPVSAASEPGSGRTSEPTPEGASNPAAEPASEPGTGRGGGGRLEDFDRIGIILAGGGAKGAYQAGALKAIHEFLVRHDALGKVKMIAGTSIGSWNSMFWLAELVGSPEGGASAHERWWRDISLGRIVEFDTYLPLRKNSFVRPTPWKEMFDGIFAENEGVRDRLAALFPEDGSEPSTAFYLTRSNVERGHLEFATNSPRVEGLTRTVLSADGEEDRKELAVKPDRYEIIRGGDLRECLARTRRAVFASMDLPPLFPYARIRGDRDEWFEDGGVVDNLPIRFGTEIENCDLLFVLPLNASFTEKVDHTSITRRLGRVLDVRQGVMERNSLKMVYLYNELAVLRRRLERARREGGPGREGSEGPGRGREGEDARGRGEGTGARGEDAAEERLTRTSMKRSNDPVSVFSIVPEAPLAIGTQEFWKPTEAGQAFDLLYEATKLELLEHFEDDTNPEWIRMVLVNPFGERTYFDDF